MAGPGFGDLRVAESVGGPSGLPPTAVDPKVERVLELLPRLKNPQSREKALAFLKANGVSPPSLAPLGIETGERSSFPMADADRASGRVTLSEAADRLAGKYDEATLQRLRAGDQGALSGLRPSDRADIERSLGERRAAAENPAAHAPMSDRPGGLAGELDARTYEQAPVTRSRSGAPKPEYTHTTGERIAAGSAQPLAGAVKGAGYATGRLSELPARMMFPGGQAVVDELAETSKVTAPAAVASSMLPMSLGSRAAGAVASMVPEVAAAPGLMNMGLRGAAGLGRATAAGAAAGAADAGGAALNEVAQGMPAGEVPGMMAQGAIEAVPASLAMYPFFAGMQKLGRSAVDDLRRSPDLGPPVLALEAAGLNTRLPIANREMSMRAVQSEAPAPSRPGRMPFTREVGPEPEGSAIAAAQREQQATGRPAATITGERAGQKALGSLEGRKDEMLGRHRSENEAMTARLQDQRVTTEPVGKHLMDLVKRGKFDDGSPLPGVEDGGKLARDLNRVATVRWANPGEDGIDPEAARALGLKVPAAAARAQGDTIPPPGGRRRAQAPKGVVIEAKDMSTAQLEEAISAFDDISGAASNVKKKGAAKAAESIGAVLRGMRNQFRTAGGDHVLYDRRGNDPVIEDDGSITSSYSRTKREHGVEHTKLEDDFKTLGLSERVDELRPEDANQLRAVVGKIMGGDPALQKIFPDDPDMQRELRIAAAHQAFDDLYGVSAPGRPNVVASQAGPHGVLSLGGSARLAFDPIARGLAGTGMSPEAQRGLSGSRAGRAAPRVPPETVNKFLAMIGLGKEEE